MKYNKNNKNKRNKAINKILSYIYNTVADIKFYLSFLLCIPYIIYVIVDYCILLCARSGSYYCVNE